MLLYFGNSRNMETGIVCFPPPLSACFPLPSESSANEAEAEDESLEALREIASSDCYLCKFDELFGEDWD